MKKIILASGSPRRQELLKGLDLDFEVRLKKGIEESYPDDLPAVFKPHLLLAITFTAVYSSLSGVVQFEASSSLI